MPEREWLATLVRSPRGLLMRTGHERPRNRLVRREA